MDERAWKIKPAGDRAVLVKLGDSISEVVNQRVMELERKLAERRLSGIVETVPAFASLLVCYNPLITDYEAVAAQIRKLENETKGGMAREGRIVEIPVCYGGEYGEDLPFVARHAGLTEEEVVRIHSERIYRIYMLGFLPGFPYLGGLDARIFTPRLAKPRIRIPAGSVGIGGEQTGIYPVESPGGWQLIGRTPYRLFSPDMNGRLLYEAGDRIRFVPISGPEFGRIDRAWREDEKKQEMR